MTRTFRPGCTAALFVLCAGLLGCGGGVGSVEGTVTFKPNSKKLAWGTVIITGRDNLQKVGTINKDGTYVVHGVPAGEAKITVSSDDPKATGDGDRRGGGRGGEGEVQRPPDPNAPDPATTKVDPEIAKAWFPIPKKYANPLESPLTVTVKGGVNKHDIVLE